MPCPTCGHTMQCTGERIYWCPRCGTVKDESGECDPNIATPALVRRVRRFREMVDSGNYDHASAWIMCGLEESINLPEQRKDK